MSETALSAPRLEACEEKIERCRQDIGERLVGMGRELKEIRDQRLYKASGCANFDTYCRERWNMSRVHAHRLIAAAEVGALLPIGNGSPALKESHVRELLPLKDDETALVEVYQEAREVGGDAITAKKLRQLVMHRVRRIKREDEKEKERVRTLQRHEAERLEALRRAARGAVAVPLTVEASHAYDFECSGEPVRFALCEELLELGTGIGFLKRQPNFSSETGVFALEEVPVLSPDEPEMIAAASSRRFWERSFDPDRGDVDLSVTEPTTRPLTWAGSEILLPTGHWQAMLFRGELRRWWVWDRLFARVGKEVRTAARPRRYEVGRLHISELLRNSDYGRQGWEKWVSSEKAIEALASDLEAVRAHAALRQPDLNDPATVCRLGERVLREYECRRPVRRRFDAYCQWLRERGEAA